MLPRCPHCFLRVIPKPDQVCPSCNQSMEANSNPDLDLVEISAGESLPCVCYNCGLPSQSTKPIKIWQREEVFVENTVPIASALLAVFSFLLLPFTMFASQSGTTNVDMSTSLRVPTCLACNEQEPKIIGPAQSRAAIKIVAHKRFLSALQLHRSNSV